MEWISPIYVQYHVIGVCVCESILKKKESVIELLLVLFHFEDAMKGNCIVEEAHCVLFLLCFLSDMCSVFCIYAGPLFFC